MKLLFALQRLNKFLCEICFIHEFDRIEGYGKIICETEEDHGSKGLYPTQTDCSCSFCNNVFKLIVFTLRCTETDSNRNFTRWSKH